MKPELEYYSWHTLEETLGVGAINTVSNGADNGANDCLASKLADSMRHGTTEKAINNVLGVIKSRFTEDEETILKKKGLIIIAGHGYAGAFETGSGQNGTYDPKWDVMTWNQSAWEPHFKKLKRENFKILRILSCDTGAEQDGADLLFEMAKIIGKPVAARTGLTTCSSSGITYQDGSVWQVATPTHKPNPIPSPSEKMTNMIKKNDLLIYLDEKYEEIAITDIKSIEIIRLTHEKKATNQKKYETQEEIKDIGNLFLTGQIGGEGKPLGKLTGEVHIYISWRKKEFMKNLTIYNNKYIYDQESDQTYLIPTSATSYMQYNL